MDLIQILEVIFGLKPTLLFEDVLRLSEHQT